MAFEEGGGVFRLREDGFEKAIVGMRRGRKVVGAVAHGIPVLDFPVRKIQGSTVQEALPRRSSSQVPVPFLAWAAVIWEFT